MNKLPYKFIAVEGNIGAGKTTLAGFLASYTQSDLLLERFEENPYLKDFYSDKAKFALHTEMFFLNDRKRHIQDFFRNNSGRVVADFTIFKSRIFASINLSRADKNSYLKEFRNAVSGLPFPDLIIYLQDDPENIKKKISNRGRLYEQQIEESYLFAIEEAYQAFWKSRPELNVLQIQSGQLFFPYSEMQLKRVFEYLIENPVNGINVLDINKI